MSRLSPTLATPTGGRVISPTVISISPYPFYNYYFSSKVSDKEKKEHRRSQNGVTNLRHQRGTICEKMGDKRVIGDVRDRPWAWTYWRPEDDERVEKQTDSATSKTQGLARARFFGLLAVTEGGEGSLGWLPRRRAESVGAWQRWGGGRKRRGEACGPAEVP